MAGKLFAHLLMEVKKPGLCIQCGACAAACQVNAIENGELVGVCEKCGFCYAQCPQTGDSEKLENLVFGENSSDHDFGIYKNALSVKTTDRDIEKESQNGGAATSILVSLLDQDYIDAAVVMGTGETPWKPQPKVATSKNDLIESGGTKFSPGPILSGLRDAVDLYGKEKIAIIGTPCQIKALRRMQFDDMALYHLSDHIELVIGLFCMGSYDYSRLKEFVEKELELSLENVEKFDKKDEKLIIYPEEEAQIEIPLDSPELKDISKTACELCPDFTSELADISIGSAGSPDNRSTVIVRTDNGLSSFEIAKNNSDLLDVKPLDSVEPGIELLKNKAESKKKSAEKNLDRRKNEDEPITPCLEEESD